MFLWGTYKSVEFVNSEMVKGRQWFDQLLIDGLEYKRTTDDIKNACIAIKKIADNGVDIFVSIEKMESLVELCSLVDSLTIVGDTIRQYGSIPLSSPIES
jgi:hypothetical protein